MPRPRLRHHATMSTTPSPSGPPPAVTAFVGAALAIPGIASADLAKHYLPGLDPADLSLPGPHADLPAAALRRTGGGLEEELLLVLEFTIERNEAGLKALEFLAWWVRDQARGGENMQLRALGLPPLAGGEKQLGQTLRFSLDWFLANPSQDMDAVLQALAHKAMGLDLALSLYASAF